MENKKDNFKPFELIEIKNVIRRKGYFSGIIEDANYIYRDGKQILKVGFSIDRGKYKGFKLSTNFYDSFKSRARLSYLYRAVGITDKNAYPDKLVGKRLKMRIVPNWHDNMGKSYITHSITMFHPIDRNI